MFDVLLSVKDISFVHNDQRLLFDVSVDVLRHEILTIIGPNGAGKTTLLRMMLGLLKPTSGVVLRAPNVRIGYMPQRLEIERSLPLLVRTFLSLQKPKMSFERALKLTDTAHLWDRSLHVLSGGEFQRVLLARAILSNPSLLILDEPLQGVDVAGQSSLYQLIYDLRKTLECAIVLVSHDLHFVHAASDRVICLNGHVCCVGHPQEVKNNPQYHTLFGESLPLVLAPYTHAHDHAHTPSGECLPKEPSDG